MSSLLRVLRLKNYSHICKIVGVTTKEKVNVPFKLRNIAAISSAQHKISFRPYTVQSPREDLDGLSNQSNFDKVETEFIQCDNFLRRGGFLTRKRILQLHNIVKRSKNLNPSQTLFLITCCGAHSTLETPETRNKLASEIWSSYLERELSLDISHYNALLQVFLENDHKFSPLDFLATLQDKNIEPNRITYSRLIARFCQEGDIEGANKILEFMKEKELPIGENVFNSLIIGNSRTNDLEGARNIIEVMKASGVTVGSDTYSTLLQAYAEHNDMESIRKVLDQCQEEEILISSRALMDVVCVLADHGEMNHIEEILSKVEKKDGHIPLVRYTISRLLGKGHGEIAFQVYKTLPGREGNVTWSFFPRLLAASNIDLHQVVKYCDEVKNNEWNILSFELTLESYLQDKKFDRALGLLRAMKEKGLPLKEHYFYPLFCTAGEANDREGVFKLFEETIQMEVDFSSLAMSTFVIPNLKPLKGDLMDVEAIYMRLLNYQGQTNPDTLYNGLVECLLRINGADFVAEFVGKFRRGIRWTLRVELIQSFLNGGGSADSTVCILRQMLPLTIRLNRDLGPTTEAGLMGIKFFLSDLMRVLRKRNELEERFQPVLNKMVEYNVSISPAIATQLSQQLGTDLTPEMEQTLETLSNIFTGRAPDSGRRNFGEGHDSGEQNIRRRIEKARAEGTVTPDLKIALLISLVRQNKIEEVEENLAKMKSDELSIPPVVQVMIINMYIEVGQLRESQAAFDCLVNENPGFQMSSHKVVKMAALLIKEGRTEDAVKFFLMNSPEDGMWSEETKANFEDHIHRRHIFVMLDILCENKDLASLKLVQEILLVRKFSSPNVVLPSLVRYYLKEDNLEEAMSAFEKISDEYNITSAKEALTIACINKEDSEKIQLIIDVSSKIHGDMNTLYDLAFAFIEVGKVKQAEKILQTSGLRTMQTRLNERCEMYVRMNKFAQLEGLVAVTKTLFNVNREKLYNYLLQGAILTNDPDKALDVWTTMQEEGVNPSSSFLMTLGMYLQSKGLEVPFVLPEMSSVRTAIKPPVSTTIRPPAIPRNANQTKDPEATMTLKQKFVLACDNANYEEVDRVWQSGITSGEKFSVDLECRYIHTLVRRDRLEEAFERTCDLFSGGGTLPTHLLKNLLNKLAQTGDVAKIRGLEKYLDEESMRKTAYHHFEGLAHIQGGLVEEYLTDVQKNGLESSEIDTSFTKVPSSLIRKVIEDFPQFYPLLVKIAEAHEEKRNPSMFASLWDAHISNGDAKEAEDIYSKHLENVDVLPVGSVCRKSFITKNVQKLKDVLKFIDRKPEGRERSKGQVLSAYLDLLNVEKRFDESFQLLEDSLKSLKLEHFRHRCINALEKEFKRQNKPFPYSISSLRNKEKISSSSSSSSSDEDVKK